MTRVFATPRGPHRQINNSRNPGSHSRVFFHFEPQEFGAAPGRHSSSLPPIPQGETTFLQSRWGIPPYSVPRGGAETAPPADRMTIRTRGPDYGRVMIGMRGRNRGRSTGCGHPTSRRAGGGVDLKHSSELGPRGKGCLH